MTQYRPSDRDHKKEFIMCWKNYPLLDIFKKQNEIIGKKCGNEIIFLITDKLQEVLKNEYGDKKQDYLYIWIKDFNKNDFADHTNDADKILTKILRDILITKCNLNKNYGKEILKELLSAKKYTFSIFKKLALFCIDKYWNDYKELFYEFFENNENIFEEPSYETEIYDILSKYNGNFSENIITTIKKRIKNVPKIYIENNYLDFWKWKWLSPLAKNKDFIVEYE